MHSRNLVLVILALAIPHDADADAKTEAKLHIDKAQALFADDKASEALSELKTAYALDPKPELLYAIGQAHASLGQCADAKTFWARFLATKPAADVVALTQEAIKACVDKPQEVTPIKPDEPPPPPPPPPLPPPHVDAPAGPRPWYTDVLGDALVGGGVACGVVGLLEYSSAKSDRDAADATSDLQTFSDLIDRANSKRTLSIVFGVAGGALITGGIVRYLVHDRSREPSVQVTPMPGGGAVTWGGRF